MTLTDLCRLALRDLRVDGAVVSVVGQPTAAAGPTARQIEELEFSTGEGPGLDAHRDARPVLTPDLAAAVGRWPGYAPAALALGTSGSFALPLHVGAAQLGVLHLHGNRAGSLSRDEMAGAFVLAEQATDLIVDSGTDLAAEVGIATALGQRDEVYQAQGMLTVELGVSLGEALARMRAPAFGTGTTLTDVATGIVAGSLVLPRDNPSITPENPQERQTP